MDECVLDTSVAIKWYSSFGEADLANALLIRSRFLEGKIRLVVPELFFYEFANAMRYNRNFSCGEVEEFITGLFEMGLEVERMTPELVNAAISFAYVNGLSVYDSCFIALAIKRGCSFITADKKCCDMTTQVPQVKYLGAL